jgi:hypothetical protein
MIIRMLDGGDRKRAGAREKSEHHRNFGLSAKKPEFEENERASRLLSKGAKQMDIMRGLTDASAVGATIWHHSRRGGRR